MLLAIAMPLYIILVIMMYNLAIYYEVIIQLCISIIIANIMYKGIAIASNISYSLLYTI